MQQFKILIQVLRNSFQKFQKDIRRVTEEKFNTFQVNFVFLIYRNKIDSNRVYIQLQFYPICFYFISISSNNILIYRFNCIYNKHILYIISTFISWFTTLLVQFTHNFNLFLSLYIFTEPLLYLLFITKRVRLAAIFEDLHV